MLSFIPVSEDFKALRAKLRPLIWQFGLLSAVCNLLMLLPSIYMLQVYDRVLGSRSEATLLLLTLMLIALYVVFGVLEWARSRQLIDIGAQIDDALASRVFTAAYERNLRNGGSPPSQALQDVAMAKQFIAGPGLTLVFDAPWVPIYMLVIFLLHPALGVLSVVAGVVLFMLALASDRKTSASLKESSKEAMAAQLYASNNLKQTDVIESMGMLERIRARWLKRHMAYVGLQNESSEAASSISATIKVVRIMFQSLALGLGAWLAIQGAITPGGMIAATIIMSRALAPVEQGIGVWRQWLTAQLAIERIAKLLNDFVLRPKPTPLPQPEGDVRFENVSVVPPGGKIAVLKDLTFAIQPGDAVAVMGPSASGKSSLARALLGVWPPARGKVRWAGADVASWYRPDFGGFVGYLPQAIELFEGTVADNIARFHPVEGNEVVQAAQMAGAHDMILRLPQGYDTPVGADGHLLSAGQRQRVGLARALFAKPSLVVLDEPNSNLDEQGEAALSAAILALRQQAVIVVVITHRTGLLQAVNKLLVLRDGELVVYGPKEQVLDHLRQSSEQAALPPPKGNV